MRWVALLLALLLSGCTVPGAEPPLTAEPPATPLPAPPEQVPVPPAGHLEVRWPGGEWAAHLRSDETLRHNATGAVTELPAPAGRMFEVRFVADEARTAAGAGNATGNATWEARWYAWSWYGSGNGGRSTGDPSAVQTFSADPGRNEVVLEFATPTRDRVHHVGSATVVISWSHEVHGTVQPLPAQSPDAPAVRHEVRVPTGGAWGSLLATTEALGDPPATGRDLRLGALLRHEEFCTEPPTPGVRDHTDHVLQAESWDATPMVRLYVGNPTARCSSPLTDPVNAEPVDYVLRIRFQHGGDVGAVYYTH